MGTAVGAHLENPKPQQSERVVPRAYAAWLLGIFLLTSFWLWAAFVRGRVHSRASQLLLLLVCAALLAGFGWLVSGALRRRFSLSSREGAKILAYSSSAFLLLLVFFPEYLMGRPVLVRSFLLLGFSLLLFAFYLALSLRGAASSIKRPQPNVAPAIALVIFCAAYFVLTSWITLAKLHAFGYVGQDIAYFTQCLYTTLHGQLLYSNMYHDLLYGKPVTSDLAGHNQLVLFLFLPFFMLHKAASTLLIVRNFAIVLCAWPVYLIGRRFLSPWLAAIAAIAFLLLPAVLYQNFYDFAPLSLAGLPLLFALYYYLEDRFVPYLIALICVQIVREDLVFAVFGLGLLALWQRRSRRWVAIPCAFALGWTFLSWKIVFPHFLQGATPAVASCFSYLGASPGEMVRNIMHHPGMLLSHKNLLYTKQMVDSYGGVLFLLNPAWIISIPYIAINVLAEGGGCNTAMIYRHYSLIPTVFLFASVLLALKRVGTRAEGKGRRAEIAQAAILLFVLMAALSSTVFVTGTQQWDDLQSRPWHQEANQVAAMLPPNASAAVPRYLLPAVANRDSLYQSLRLLEYHHPDAGYIVIDKDWQRMAATEQWRENYNALWHLLEISPQYQMTYDSPNYVIYKLCDGCAPNLPHREPMKEMRD
ncbi:MAG TPA: DUF2079 domain-containing protein [Candidatus Angelobacter sp.]|nr:DUF2079 domain-containing protein [Candidatus Angelobacter sp.]